MHIDARGLLQKGANGKCSADAGWDGSMTENSQDVVIDGGILRGIVSPETAGGYVGEEGFYLILGSFRKDTFQISSKGTPNELALNIEQIQNSEDQMESPRFAMRLALSFAEGPRMAEIIEGYEKDFSAVLIEFGNFSSDPSKTFFLKNAKANLSIREEVLPDGTSIVIDVVKSVGTLDELTEKVLPSAIGLFNAVFTDFPISDEVLPAVKKVAQKSNQALLAQV